MAQNDILAAIREIYIGDADNAVVTPLLDKLEEVLPHSAISDLVFHDFRGLTPEQVMDEALRREADYVRKTSQG